MTRYLLALVTGIVLAVGVAACGGGNDSADVVPKTTPAITPPSGGDLAPNGSGGASSSSSSTTSTTDTTTTDTTATTPDTSGTGSGAAGTGGTSATPQTTTPQTGGTSGTPQTNTSANPGGASAGGFSDFCKQNPGACPGQ